MKRILFSCAFLFAACFAAPAWAADWSVLSSGDAQAFRAIAQSGNNLVAAGSNGNIYYSTDLGSTWVKAFATPSITFNDFATMPNGDLLVIGSGGINEISSDHGVTWSLFSFGISQTLNNIDVKTISGSSTGYLVGNGGVYRNYANGTGNWETQNLGITTDLFGVEDRGSGTGWLVGADGKIFKVILGGTSWGTVESGTRETLRSVRFVNDQKGFIVGTQGTMLKTTDGGLTWTSVTIAGLSNQTLNTIDVSSNTIVIAGERVLIVSTDAGETWQVKTFDGTQKKFFGALVKDADHIYAVGSDDDAVSLVYQFKESAPVIPPVVVEPSPTTPVGSLIKTACKTGADVNDPCKAVYFYAADGKRHAFPNDKVYFSWFTDFSTVKEVSADFMSSLTLGKNVTYRPGIKMVKFQSIPTVYAVARGNILRPIATETIASLLYGQTWNKQIDDISDVFYKNYSIGDMINSSADYDVVVHKVLPGSLSETF